MNPTYEQLSARVKELETGVTAINKLVHAVDFVYPQRLNEARKFCLRMLQNDDFLQQAVIPHKGQQYYATGKVGNRLSDGMMGREFRTDDDSRCWLYRDLSIKDD